MPPKKTAANGEAGDGKFIWEGANETKLLMIMLGRHIGTSEFDDVAKAFPGATGGAIRNRIGVLRGKQKKVYEELGWELPSGGATPAKKAKVTPSKRAAGDEEGGEPETPTKKPRAPRKKKETKSATPEEKGSAADDDEKMSDGVKKEVEEV
ncbi:hypothetical protein N0V86_005177 [Didymella sp. IMI 355093]|nr:hypothetical protein N0V86_005177 [Didymella sp. IMI 355093]